MTIIQDPLLDHPLQDKSEHNYTYGPQQWLGSLLLLFLIIFLTFFFVSYAQGGGWKSWFSEHIYWYVPAFILLFGLLRFAGPLVPPWRIIRKIRVDLDGIEIDYRFTRAVRVLFPELKELRLEDQTCLLMTNSQLYTFPASQRLGLHDRLTLLRTIVERAKLRYLEGRVGELIYQRSE